jgi:aminoglycoside phosphotransferase (APT) family kinase protein
VRAGLAAAKLAPDAFDTPRLLTFDRQRGAIIWSALPGTALHDLLDTPQLRPAAYAAGRALAALHAAPQPIQARTHGAADEQAVLRGWLDRTRAFEPTGSDLEDLIAPILTRLSHNSLPPVPLHRDFYDKQIFWDATNGRIGLLDFDTLAIGEAALDLANVLVHFELRVLQGRCTHADAENAIAALLDGYQPSAAMRDRVAVYADAARLRLCCVYTFRPDSRAVISHLRARIGQPIGRWAA